MLGSGNLNTQWVLAYRYADVPQRRPRSRFTADYNVSSRLQIGFEYNFLVEEIGFRGSWIASEETDTLPQVHFGTSSDRIGTPEGFQQYSVTFAKSIPETKLAPYLSVTYSEFDRGLVFPFGANYQIDSKWSVIGMYDGHRSHILLNYAGERWYAQLGWIWLKHPSITIGWGF